MPKKGSSYTKLQFLDSCVDGKVDNLSLIIKEVYEYNDIAYRIVSTIYDSCNLTLSDIVSCNFIDRNGMVEYIITFSKESFNHVMSVVSKWALNEERSFMWNLDNYALHILTFR